MRKNKRRLTVYIRHGCHLCEALLAELESWRVSQCPGLASAPAPDWGLEFELVDVDRDPLLVKRHGEFVPVLAEGESVICHYFFDPEALERHLAARHFELGGE